MLVAVGRTPNTEGLNLEAAGVGHGERGIDVDDRLRTSNRRIFAAGDVCSPYQFTHAADAMARIVIQNALFLRPQARQRTCHSLGDLHVSGSRARRSDAADEAATRLGAETVTVQLADVDRAVIDGETDGFVRIHHRAGRIVAATLVAPHAGELIGQVASLMRRGGSLGDFSGDIFPYPTVAEVAAEGRRRVPPHAADAAGQALLRTVLRVMRRF